jgi:hypothetical protein
MLFQCEKELIYTSWYKEVNGTDTDPSSSVRIPCREIGWLLSFVYFLVGWNPGAASLPHSPASLPQKRT